MFFCPLFPSVIFPLIFQQINGGSKTPIPATYLQYQELMSCFAAHKPLTICKSCTCTVHQKCCNLCCVQIECIVLQPTHISTSVLQKCYVLLQHNHLIQIMQARYLLQRYNYVTIRTLTWLRSVDRQRISTSGSRS